jgi:hypothetical protein
MLMGRKATNKQTRHIGASYVEATMDAADHENVESHKAARTADRNDMNETLKLQTLLANS